MEGVTETPVVTRRERDLIRHAIGWPRAGEIRNYSSSWPGSRDDVAWSGLVDRGLAESLPGQSWSPGLNWYRVTDAGMRAAE